MTSGDAEKDSRCESPSQGRILNLAHSTKKVSPVSEEDRRRLAEAARTATRNHPFPSIKEVEDGTLETARRQHKSGGEP